MHPPATDGYMYVCGDSTGGAGPRYECAFEGSGAMDQPTFEDHMFSEFSKDRQVQVVVGAGGELQYREDLPVYAGNEQKRKEEPLLLQAVETVPTSHAQHPPPPPPPSTSKKSDKKKSENNGIKKKKTRYVI